MNKNYMTYPLKYMRITCRYDEGSHRNHCINVTDGLIDYPIDDAGKDTGRDPIYCPCDEMKVTNIQGVGNGYTNTVWLVSTSPVVTPTFTDIAYISLTHSNDSDFQNMKVGDTFKRGEIICYEGTDGATANHIHMSCGKGYSDNWKENSNGAWIMTPGEAKKPEDVFYIDRNFTTKLWGGYLIWKDLPQTEIVGTPVTRDISVDQVEVLVDNLNARSDATTSSTSYGYIKKGIYNVVEQKENEGYIWVKVENYWIATNEGWTNYYPKEEDTCLEKLKKLEQEYPRLIFNCNKSGKYLIYLEAGKSLYLK